MQLRDSQKAIGIKDERIVYVCDIRNAPDDAETINLTDTILMPGFVNAHCHLDLSHLAGQFSYKGSFSEWVRDVMTKRLTPDADAMRAAAQSLIESGVTSVNDHVGVWSDLSPILDLPLRYRFFVEVSGVTPETSAARLQMAQDLAVQLQCDGRIATATPHSPYSLHAATRDALIAQSKNLLSIHYAESTEEQDYFATGTGGMADFLHELGASTGKPTTMPFPPEFLAVHCNTVTDNDIQRLKDANATVVHCPRSHLYFDHPPFPLQKLRDAGIPIQIGTDSLASCPNFDFLEELRTMRMEFPFLTATEILKMASGNCQAGGAGWGPRFRQQAEPRGSLGIAVTEGDADKWGDPATGHACKMPFADIRFNPTPRPYGSPYADIIGLPVQDDILQGPVTFSMIGGKRVI